MDLVKTILNKIIRALGRPGYSVDENLSLLDVSIVLSSRAMQVLRGGYYKLVLKNTSGILFVGKNCKLMFKHKIKVGRSLTLGDNVEINALSKSGVEIGHNVTILKNSIIECTGVIRELGEGLIIGNNTGISQNAFIQVRGKVKIGNYVIIGPNVSIFSENHNSLDLSKYIVEQGATRGDVEICDGVWVGSGSIILAGVKVGENSIIAAGSVVLEDVPSGEVWGGVPAKYIKKR